MHTKINDSFYISDIAPSDKSAYLEHLAEKQIYDQTWAIPFPYTEADADWWIHHVAEETKKLSRSVTWAIRRSDGYLVGGIGFVDSELGYWLAKPYWGQGLMTEAVQKACEIGFRNLGLLRITAHVFDFNVGSAKVLEKSGFQLEEILKNHYKKDGRIVDAKLYQLLLLENSF